MIDPVVPEHADPLAPVTILGCRGTHWRQELARFCRLHGHAARASRTVDAPTECRTRGAAMLGDAAYRSGKPV